MREKIISICFFVMIISITTSTIIKMIIAPSDKTSDSVVEQELGETSLAPTSKPGFIDSVKKVTENFSDEITVKDEFIEINTNLSASMSEDTYIESTQILLGKDNWLFYKSQEDGSSIPDYRGTDYYTDEELLSIKHNLIKQRDAFAEKGIRFIVMPIPNKEIIYFEYMPDTIFRESTTTRTDLLVNYLKENSDLEIVYPKNELMEGKLNNPVYYKYDSHWNDIGCYIGLQSLTKQLYGVSRDVTEFTFPIAHQNTSGDLAILCNMQEKFCDDTMYALPENIVSPEDVFSDNILIIGDSFAEPFVKVAKHFFQGGANYLSLWSYNAKTIEEFNPNIVVWQSVERYTDRYRTSDLTNMN